MQKRILAQDNIRTYDFEKVNIVFFEEKKSMKRLND